LHNHHHFALLDRPGANQCVMAAKLGAKTAMVGKVGEDIFGKDTYENFKSLGVDTTFLFSTADAATGCAPITVRAPCLTFCPLSVEQWRHV